METTVTDQSVVNAEVECDGMCVTPADLGVPEAKGEVAYSHPGCPRHDPENICQCGTPDQCLSPTHGQISLPDALRIRHAQRPGGRP